MDSQKPINLIFFQKNEKTLEKQMSYIMLFANLNNVYDSSMFNNWLSNNSEENKQLCAYPFSSPSDLENGADDIMNQAHAFVAVFEQDSGRSTNTRYLSVLSGSLLLESDFGSAEAKRRR